MKRVIRDKIQTGILLMYERKRNEDFAAIHFNQYEQIVMLLHTGWVYIKRSN